MTDFFYRTEVIRSDEILDYFVETKEDRIIIDTLKSHNPVILIGSRGIGKSFLLKVAQCELESDFDKNFRYILPSIRALSFTLKILYSFNIGCFLEYVVI